MKTLWILRHAHASRANPRLPDHARPLDERGESEAARVARQLCDNAARPALILASTATRARATAQAVAEACGIALTLHDSLYNAPAEAYLPLLQALSDEVTQVMVVGHNPGLETLLYQLTRRDEALVPSALAQVELPIEQWGELGAHTRGTLLHLHAPDR